MTWSQNMKLTVQSQEGDMFLVAVSGHACQKFFPANGDPLVELLGKNCYGHKVLLDLSGLEELDSSGVGWLLASHRRFRSGGGILVLHSLSTAVRDVIKMLKMHLVFNLAEGEPEALKLATETK
jgi:anti-anti-sigma factor